MRRWRIEDSVGLLAWGGVRLLGVVLRQPEKTFSTASANRDTLAGHSGQNAKPEIDPTLAERQSDAAPRHDCRVGNDELTTLRCDKLVMLALRGFERPCAWSEAECGRRWTFKSEHPGTKFLWCCVAL